MEVKGPKRLICLDVGNSSASYAVYQGRTLNKNGILGLGDVPYFIIKLINKIDSHPYTVIILSSVVPKITIKILKLTRNRDARDRVRLVGKDLKVPMSHKYRNINKLGVDRLVTAYGALKLYGAPLLVLDYGTALTCDYISGKGVFEGGLIIPGPEIALKALSEKAALLPRMSFPKRYLPFIGRDTRGGMKAGILQGYGAMTDGLVARFRRRYGSRFRVVATGGLAKRLTPYTTQIDILDPLLTLKSLERLFRDRVNRVKSAS